LKPKNIYRKKRNEHKIGKITKQHLLED